MGRRTGHPVYEVDGYLVADVATTVTGDESGSTPGQPSTGNGGGSGGSGGGAPLVVAGVQAQGVTTLSDGSSSFTPVTPAPFTAIPEGQGLIVRVDPDDALPYVAPVVGYGATLTDASAYVLQQYLTPAQRKAVLTDLFSPDAQNFGVLCLQIGACTFQSPLGLPYYSYDDTLAGAVDPSLTNFDMSKDAKRVFAVAEEILSINPGVKILARAHSAPPWMKTGSADGWTGGTLNPTYYQAYANYLLKYVQTMREMGLPVWAITTQNEPANFTISPSMDMSGAIAGVFVGQYLGPTFAAQRIQTKILVGDTQFLNPEYARDALADTTANPYIAGIGWHGYSGSSGAVWEFTRQTGKEQHFTEYRSLLSADFPTNLKDMAAKVFYGAQRMGCSSVCLWNLALDETGEPSNGYTGRRGVITVPSSGSGVVTKHAEAYLMQHFSRYVRRGARQVACSSLEPTSANTDVQAVAYRNRDDSVAVFVHNPTTVSKTFIVSDSRSSTGFTVTLAAGQVATYTWGLKTLNTPAGSPVTVSAPGAVATFGVTPSAGRNTVAWTAPASVGGAPITRYIVQRGTAPGALTDYAVLHRTTLSYVDYEVTAGTTYYYAVIAQNLGGRGTVSATQSGAPTAASVPTAPTLAVPTILASTVSLTWTENANNGAPVSSYQLMRGTTPGGSKTLLATINEPGYTYTDVAFTVGGTYYYTLIAVNSAGSSAASTERSIVVPTSATVFDAKAQSKQASTQTPPTTLSWTHTPVGTPSLAVVSVGFNVNTTPQTYGVTYGGVAMVKTASTFSGTSGSDRQIDIWTLASPLSGAQTVAATATNVGAATGNVTMSGQSYTFTGTTGNFGTPATAGSNSASATTLTATITNTPASLVFIAAIDRSTGTPTVTGSGTISNSQSQVAGTNVSTTTATQPGGASVASTSTWTPAGVGALIALPIL